MPEVNVYTDRARPVGGKTRIGVVFEVDGVRRQRRVRTWPDDFPALWALLDADEQEALAEELTQRFVRAKIENIGDIRIATGR